MSCIWIILLWMMCSNQCGCNQNDCNTDCCKEVSRPCPEPRCAEKPVTKENKCNYQEDIPFLPGGRPFGAYDGNHTCGCEEKPV